MFISKKVDGRFYGLDLKKREKVVLENSSMMQKTAAESKTKGVNRTHTLLRG